ncbi:hypothetical protein [Streptomyces sp. NPDC005283]
MAAQARFQSRTDGQALVVDLLSDVPLRANWARVAGENRPRWSGS